MGMLSGNPFYSGPSPMAAGVQSFSEGLMNAYGLFEKLRQRDEELAMQKQQQAIAQQVQEAKLREMAVEDQKRQAFAELQTRLGNPVTGQSPLSHAFGPGGAAEEWTPPQVQTQYPTQAAAWAAQGKNPELEYLREASGLMSRFEPEKALDLRARVLASQSNAENREAMLALKERLGEMGMNARQAEIDIKGKNADINLKRAEDIDRHQRMMEALRKLQVEKGGSGAKDASEKDAEKAKKEAVRQLDNYISQNYSKRIAELLKKQGRMSPEEKSELSKYVAAREQTIAVKNRVLSGTLAPNEIIWGGNQTKQQDPLGIR